MATLTEGKTKANYAFYNTEGAKSYYPEFHVLCTHSGCLGKTVKVCGTRTEARTWRDKHNAWHASKP